jgi:hypothetical protein
MVCECAAWKMAEVVPRSLTPSTNLRPGNRGGGRPQFAPLLDACRPAAAKAAYLYALLGATPDGVAAGSGTDRTALRSSVSRREWDETVRYVPRTWSARIRSLLASPAVRRRRLPCDRGNGRAVIFWNDADRPRFIAQLADSLRLAGIVLHAYVPLDNHFNLLVRAPRANLSRLVQRLLSGYAMYARYKNRRPGHQHTTGGLASSAVCAIRCKVRQGVHAVSPAVEALIEEPARKRTRR